MEKNKIVYSYTKYGKCVIVIEGYETIVTKQAATLLKKVNFSIDDWKAFKQKIYLKNEKLIEIGYFIFEEDNCEHKVIALCSMMAVVDDESFREYIRYHMKRCFKITWVHILSYIHYHGFKNDRYSMAHSMVTNPRKSEIHKVFVTPIKDSISDYINKLNVDLIVYPDFKKRTYLNLFFKNKWYKVTFDIKKSYDFQKDMLLTRKLIDEIEYSLDNNISLKLLSLKYNIYEGVVISYSFNIFENKMIQYIKKKIREQLHNNEQISLYKALEFHIKQTNHRLKRLKRDNNQIYKRLQKVVTFYQKKQIKHYNIYNKNILSKNINKIKVGFIRKNIWYSQEYDFTDIENEPIKNEIKSFIYYLLIKKSDISGVTKVMSLSIFIKKFFKLNKYSAKDITKKQLIEWLNSLNVSINTKKDYKNYYSSFLNFLINVNLTKYKTLFSLPNSPTKNEIKDIEIDYDETKYTEPLPEDVYIQIRAHIDKLSQYVKNAFLIISATGCRPNELAYIEKESLYYDEKEKIYFLQLFISKQNKSYGRKGLKAIRKVPIYDEEVIECFFEQERLSRKYREIFEIDSIFVRQSNRKKFQMKHYIISSKDLIREINKLIKEFNIYSDLEETLWKYTPYQMRAMLATMMVERGHASEEIKAFFGWMTKHTSERAYAFVRKKKMMELNDAFFKEHFNVSFDNNALEQYSKEEKEQLFVELYVHYRIMEYGKCVRHPIMGECGRLQTAESCASCSRLVTSIEYLPYWERIYENQMDIVNKIEERLQNEGISKDIYQSWGEYKIEFHRLKSYETLVNKIKSKKVFHECNIK